MSEAGVDKELAVELRVVHPKSGHEVIRVRIAKLVCPQAGSVSLSKEYTSLLSANSGKHANDFLVATKVEHSNLIHIIGLVTSSLIFSWISSLRGLIGASM